MGKNGANFMQLLHFGGYSTCPLLWCGRTSDSENPKSSRSKTRMNPSHMDPLSSKGNVPSCQNIWMVSISTSWTTSNNKTSSDKLNKKKKKSNYLVQKKLKK